MRAAANSGLCFRKRNFGPTALPVQIMATWGLERGKSLIEREYRFTGTSDLSMYKHMTPIIHDSGRQ